MKKKFGLFALVLTVLLCGSLFLFAACGDGEEEEPSATPAISVTVNETARQSGATIEGDTEDTYTIAASVVNGEEGASVTISYVYESGEAETFTGSTFSPDEAGTYVFTFTAKGASNFTLTFEIAEAQAPAHEHTYGTWNVTAPTETNAGQAVRTCSECAEGTEGKTQTVTLPVLGSDEAKTAYTSKVTTPATCTVKEVVTYTYTAEGFSFTVTGAVSDEQSAHGTSLSFFDAKAATCTEAGEIAYAHCTACGKYYYKVDGNTIGEEILEGENGLTDPSRPATGHSYAVSFDTEEDYTTALGTADGQYTVDCANECGTETTIALPALTAENTWTKSEEVAATCMNPGTATFTATVDGVTVVIKGVQTAPATGHSAAVSVDFADYLTGDSSEYTWSKAVEATCNACEVKVTLSTDTLNEASFAYSSDNGTLIGTIKQGNDTVTVTVTNVPEPETPVISLTVKIGDTPIQTGNGGNTSACIDTQISYEAAVTGGGAVSASYTFENGEAKNLAASGNFKFEELGTYVFTIKADGAADYVYTVEIVAHDFTDQPYISVGEDGHYQVCKNCNVAHSETVAHVLQAENNNTQHWQGCAVCDYETAKSDHVLTWQSDDTQHWQACSGCAYTTAKENHSYAIAYADGTVDYVCECGKVSASATVTITVTGGTGVVAAEAFSWTGEEFEIDLSQVEISELAADVKVVYYRIADELIVTDESYAFAESVAIEAVLEDTQATIGGTGVHWNETAWSSVLKKGDAMTVAGQLDSTAAFNWQGVFVQVYSTENVVGAFRLDNYINGEEGPEDNAAYSTGENFILTKDGTYTDFNEKGTFINLIKDCTLRITIDWTNPALIEITLNLTGKVDGVNKVQTVCYTIAAKPDTSLKDSYTIGLGYEEATYAISSVERCDGQHGDAELFCSVCNELNKTALDAAATETAAWDNGVTLGADAFVMKATITGNDAYGVFYELITQVDGDFVTAEAPKGYVDVHASNVQDTGTYFNAWGGGNNGFDSTADKMIVQHGTRPVGADAWSGGVYTIYAFRDTQGSGMLYVEYTKDGSTYGAGVYLQNWAANVSVRFTAVGVMTEGASVTVLTGAYPAA